MRESTQVLHVCRRRTKLASDRIRCMLRGTRNGTWLQRTEEVSAQERWQKRISGFFGKVACLFTHSRAPMHTPARARLRVHAHLHTRAPRACVSGTTDSAGCGVLLGVHDRAQ